MEEEHPINEAIKATADSLVRTKIVALLNAVQRVHDYITHTQIPTPYEDISELEDFVDFLRQMTGQLGDAVYMLKKAYWNEQRAKEQPPEPYEDEFDEED